MRPKNELKIIAIVSPVWWKMFSEFFFTKWRCKGLHISTNRQKGCFRKKILTMRFRFYRALCNSRLGFGASVLPYIKILGPFTPNFRRKKNRGNIFHHNFFVFRTIAFEFTRLRVSACRVLEKFFALYRDLRCLSTLIFETNIQRTSFIKKRISYGWLLAIFHVYMTTSWDIIIIFEETLTFLKK